MEREGKPCPVSGMRFSADRRKKPCGVFEIFLILPFSKENLKGRFRQPAVSIKINKNLCTKRNSHTKNIRKTYIF